MISSQEFQLVAHKRRRNRNVNQKHPKFTSPTGGSDFIGSGCVKNVEDSGYCGETDCENVVKAVLRCREELMMSDFARRDLKQTFITAGLLEQDSPPAIPALKASASNETQPSNSVKPSSAIAEIVCYGIGNFSICPIARFQLALIGWLLDSLGLTDCSLFEPLFTAVEKAAVVQLGYKIIERNEEAKRAALPRGTLFYMPHCDKALYNNLLWTNWSPEKLSRTFILGNSFSRMHDAVPSRILKRDYSYIYRVLRCTQEWACTNSFRHDDIFNDMSLHAFRSCGELECTEGSSAENSRPVKDSDFWTNVAEPIYARNDV